MHVIQSNSPSAVAKSLLRQSWSLTLVTKQVQPPSRPGFLFGLALYFARLKLQGFIGRKPPDPRDGIIGSDQRKNGKFQVLAKSN
jgi:hypothetical protein